MTSVLTDYIKTHRATSVYIQPYCQLSENIISHSIDSDTLQKILHKYNIKTGDFTVRTCYFYEDLVLSVCNDDAICTVSYPVAKYNDNELQLVLCNEYILSSVRFPLRTKYHHERQSFIYKHHGNGWELELEVLVPLILDPKEREKERENIFNEDYDIISSSFRLILTSQGKEGTFRNEYLKLKDLIC